MFPARGRPSSARTRRCVCSSTRPRPPGRAARSRCSTCDSATPVDSIDIAAPLTSQMIGGRNYFYKPIIISGNEAYIYLRKVLKPGATYYVNIDPGVFLAGPSGAPIGAVKDDRDVAVPGEGGGARRRRQPGHGHRRRLGRLLHRTGRGRLRPGREHGAGDHQRRGRHLPRDRRDADQTFGHLARRGSERVDHLVPEQRRAADPARPDRFGGNEVARDDRRRRQQRPADREHHAVEPQPAAPDRRAVGDAADRGRLPERSCATRPSRARRTRC